MNHYLYHNPTLNSAKALVKLLKPRPELGPDRVVVEIVATPWLFNAHWIKPGARFSTNKKYLILIKEPDELLKELL